MKNSRSKQRQGRPSDIAKLDIHDWTGRMHVRIKGKTSEKEKGVFMIQQIKDKFDLSDEQIKEIVDRELIKEAYEQRNIRKNHEPVNWTRDEEGRIISPFDRESDFS